jgi:glycosyltransferase involved in cell wall biosynthesis
MEALVKSLHLLNRVHFLGPLSPPDLAETYHASDVFLLTSQFEGMPIGVLEALACGLPVVATDTGEIKTVVRDRETGRIVGDRNTVTLTDALLDVLQNPDRYPSERCSRSVHAYRPNSVLPSFLNYSAR